VANEASGRCRASINIDAGEHGPHVCWKRAGEHRLHEAEVDVYPMDKEETTAKAVVRWPNTSYDKSGYDPHCYKCAVKNQTPCGDH
jgi:hypothetical protein